MTSPSPDALAPALLAWAACHGRHDLPWQSDATPYRVWVSEIMLQQTQVATVIPYYERFMARLPDVSSLASAPLDEVLHLWTGLGYYARARNLHAAARLVVERHDGCLPDDIDTLQTLPGIGRSTAGAILALSLGQRHAILDGNARRVIARYFGVEGHPGEPETLRRLWSLAEACTPAVDVGQYTQAIMDLGAGVCTRTRPRCEVCLLRDGCVALATGRQTELPHPRPRRARPHRTTWALILQRPDGAVLLEKRPADGLWGGLWSFPLFASEDEAGIWADTNFSIDETQRYVISPYRHAFTHFDLTMHPIVVRVEGNDELSGQGYRWYDQRQPSRIGLTKPVVALLEMLYMANGV